MILIDKPITVNEIGGKAFNLLNLQIKNTPRLKVVPASFFEDVNKNNDLLKKLRVELQKILKPNCKYAVRSSAIDEDSENASFAGIHKSYLQVAKDDVFECIFKVYNSAFTQSAKNYRQLQGLKTNDIRIAVIIQEMVEADFAGVAFTINPVTDNPDEIIISVTKGLGDKLVDGSVDGTTYSVTGKEIKVSGEDILSKKQLKSLLGTIGEVVSKTATFQDIEFAIKGNKTYFLQARTISTYKGINPSERSLFIDNSNIIESYFGVTSPLTYTFAKDVYKEVYTATLKLGKVRNKILTALAPSLSEMLYYHEGKIYYNMNSWYNVNSVFPFRKSASYMENMMGVKSRTEQFKKVKMNLFDMIKLGIRFISKLKNLDKLSDSFVENFNRIVQPYYGKEISGDNQQLYDLFKSIESKIVKEFTIPVVNDCAVMIYFGLLKEKAKKLGISNEELNLYVSNHGEVESAGSATMLMRIVTVINENPTLKNDFQTLNEKQLSQKYSENSQLSKLINDYKLKFGARVRDELKLETVTMIEDETQLYTLIKENLSSKMENLPYSVNTPPTKIKKLTEKTKKYLKNRERLRLYRTYVYSVVRNIFLAYGKNFVKDGRLDNASDVFYLTKQEIFSGVGDFKNLVENRKIQMKNYEQKQTFNRIVFYGDKTLSVKTPKKGNGLKGIPSGAGIIKAKVSLLNSPTDKLERGNIILTKRTDPGWIGLFPKSSGLIVEHGSMLSHSFVVARELNLPAVVGVEGATTLINDGATVTLDGLKGEITIED